MRVDGLTYRPVGPAEGTAARRREQPDRAADGDAFGARLEAAVRSVSEAQLDADLELRRLALGESNDVHRTMIALQEADIALRTMVAVRDRVVEAYQQVMNMTI